MYPVCATYLFQFDDSFLGVLICCDVKQVSSISWNYVVLNLCIFPKIRIHSSDPSNSRTNVRGFGHFQMEDTCEKEINVILEIFLISNVACLIKNMEPVQNEQT